MNASTSTSPETAPTNPLRRAVARGAAAARRQRESYAQGGDRPLGSYAVTMAVYGAVVTGGSLLARAAGVRLPERISAGDVVRVAIATHRLSRTLAKDPVTSPLRAPFTRYAGLSGDAELHEEPRKTTPARHAVGELIACPFCLDQWVATGFVAGLVAAPRQTRLAATLLDVVAAADALQLAYAGLQRLAQD